MTSPIMEAVQSTRRETYSACMRCDHTPSSLSSIVRAKSMGSAVTDWHPEEARPSAEKFKGSFMLFMAQVKMSIETKLVDRDEGR